MTIRAVDIEGAFRGAFGYDRHLRGLIAGLLQRGVAIRLQDLHPHPVHSRHQSVHDPLLDALSRPVGAHVVLQSRMPHFTVEIPDRVSVNLTTFEATGIPQSWVEISRRHALTVVNTDAARNAWLSSGAPAENLRVCPLGVDVATYRPDVEPLRPRLADGRWIEHFRTRFLNVSAIDPRKNLLALIRSWLRATTDQDDAVLVVKLSLYSVFDYQRFQQELAQLEQHHGKRLSDAAPIHFTLRSLPDRAMPRLFAAATHYISMSRGEGWDLPMTEAAATGLALIAPDHSAYQTYLDHSIARLIPSRVVPVDTSLLSDFTRPLFTGQHWWEPDEDAAIDAIRAAIDGRDSQRSSPRERMVCDFTWTKATDRLVDILSEAELISTEQQRPPTLLGYIARRRATARSRQVAREAARRS